MAVYIGMINGRFCHTYSKKLRDEYFGKDYVTVYTLGTGRSGGTKIRHSISISEYISNNNVDPPLIVVHEKRSGSDSVNNKRKMTYPGRRNNFRSPFRPELPYLPPNLRIYLNDEEEEDES
jgi:hypothetical protein